MIQRFFLYLIVMFACKASINSENQSTFYSYNAHKLQVNDLKENSGLAASNLRDNLIYSINDSGNKPEVFLLDYQANGQGRFYLKGINNRDWEDITTGRGPGDENFIFIAEIGDNLAQYDVKYIYRFKEPDIVPDSSLRLEIEEFDSIRFRFPDGKRDAEALLIEPSTKDLYVFSKREDTVRIYLAEYPQPLDRIITLQQVGRLAVKNVVAGSISPDGREVLIKTYDHVMYWSKEPEQPAYEVINNLPPVYLPYEVEPQGESITWDSKGSGYFTLSEEPGETEASLYFYKREQ